MSADLKQSALLWQAAPGLHALTESTPDNVLSDQPHLVASRPSGASRSVSPRQTECPRESGVQAEGCQLSCIKTFSLKAFSLNT